MSREHPDATSEARLERAITRVLTTSAPLALERPRAIFRVLAIGAGFAFTRSLSGPGVPAFEPASAQFGPYATQRAAHELAQRAAVRFSAQHPQCVVGVVAIEPGPEPAPQESYRDRVLRERAEAKRVRQRERDRKKQLRLQSTPEAREEQRRKWREKQAKRSATPEGRERQRQYARAQYARDMASPERRERLREKWRAREQGTEPKAAIVRDDERAGVVPTCLVCGKPTHYYQGHAVRFCSKKPGEKRSACNTRYSAQVQAADYTAHPEKKRAKRAQDRARIQSDPERLARRVASNRAYKARRRARAKGSALLVEIRAAVPVRLPPTLRSEIISETAVLMLEGVELHAAVAEATKRSRRDENRLRYAKPVEDCFWLADTSPFSMGAYQ